MVKVRRSGKQARSKAPGTIAHEKTLEVLRRVLEPVIDGGEWSPVERKAAEVALRRLGKRVTFDANGRILVDGETLQTDPVFISRPYLAPLGVSPAHMKRIGSAVEKAASQKSAGKVR